MVYPENQNDISWINQVATDPTSQWRIMLYGIDPIFNSAADFTDPAQVRLFGELITYNSTDTDSNGRISSNGLKITNFYNKDVDFQIGQSTSSEIELDFINDDGFMTAGGTFPQHFVWNWTYVLHAEIYNSTSQTWKTVPLGMWWFEKPEQTSALIVHAKGHDAMSRIESINAAGLFDNLNFYVGVELKDIYEELEAFVSDKLGEQQQEYIGVFAGMRVWFNKDYTNWVNSDFVYDFAPCDPSKYNCRQILEMIAGVAGGNAFVSRNGAFYIKGFTDAAYGTPTSYYTIDGDATPTDIFEFSKAEYTVPQIDRLCVMYVYPGGIRTAGSGKNELRVMNNEFFTLLNASSMNPEVYNAITQLQAYTPITLKAYCSPCIESGDIVRVVLCGTTYSVPIFQQTITWAGGPFMCEIVCTGNEFRTQNNAETTAYYNQMESVNYIPSSAAVVSGVIHFYNQSGGELFNVALPVYNGGVS